MRKGEAEYSLRKGKGINRYLSKSKKTLTARFLQLKSGHRAIGYFLHRIKVINSPECWWCSCLTQTPEHLWLDCYKWRREKDKLFSFLVKDKIKFQRDRKGVAEFLRTQKMIPHLLEFFKGIEIGLRYRKITQKRE